jgi:hypothetical protein
MEKALYFPPQKGENDFILRGKELGTDGSHL